MAAISRPFVAGWNRAQAGWNRGHAVWTRARGRSSAFDHAVRAWLRFDDKRADRMAAYMSYLGVLSLFPIIALAFAVSALLVANNRVVGDAFNSLLSDGLTSILPGLGAGTGPDELFTNLQGATKSRLHLQSGGVVTAIAGVAVLLYTGSGWISAQREAVRTIFGTDPRYNRFFLIAKAHDIGVLLLLGLLLVVSVAASVLTTTGPVKRLLGLGPIGNVGTLVTIASVAVGVLTGVALFLAQHVSLAGVPGRRWRDYLPGAVVAAVGFEVLKQGAALLIQRVVGNPVYGTFGAIIAVLVWINLTSRVTLFGAAWTYTGWRGTTEAEVTTAAVLAGTPGDAASLVGLPDASAGAPGPAPDPALTPDTGRGRGRWRGRALTPVTSTVSVGLAVVATAAAVTGLLRVGRNRR